MAATPDTSSSASETSATSAGTQAEGISVAIILAGIFLLMLGQTILGRRGAGEIELQRAPQHQFDYRVDINSANAVELMHLPGIGPALAERIVNDREVNGPFGSPTDLQRVKGIGPKVVQRLEPYLSSPRQGNNSAQ